MRDMKSVMAKCRRFHTKLLKSFVLMFANSNRCSVRLKKISRARRITSVRNKQRKASFKTRSAIGRSGFRQSPANGVIPGTVAIKSISDRHKS